MNTPAFRIKRQLNLDIINCGTPHYFFIEMSKLQNNIKLKPEFNLRFDI